MSDDALRFQSPADAVPRPIVRLFKRYAGQHRTLLGMAIVASVCSPVLSLIPVYLLHAAIDGVLLDGTSTGHFRLLLDPWRGDPTAQLVVLAVLMAAAAFVASALSAIGSLAWGRFAQSVQHALRVDAFAAVESRGVAFVSHQQTGQIMSILSEDIAECNRLLERFLKDILETTARFGGIGLILLVLHWQLALLTFIVLPLMAAVAHWFIRRIRPLYAELRQRVGAFNARVENALSGIEVVAASAGGKFERHRVRAASRDVHDAQWRVIVAQSGFFPTVGVLNWWTFAGLLAVGGYWYRSGPPLVFTRELSLGVLVAFLLYNQQLAAPLTQASHLVDIYHEARAAVARIFSLIPDAPTDRPVRSVPAKIHGRIELDGVSFTYPGNARPALYDVDLAIDAGSTIGIVGATGSGKTTLLTLLLGFFEPDIGQVRFDDRDLRELDPNAVRREIGYVPQTPYLFTGTVRENVSYPGRSVTDEAIEWALRRAQAWAFVRELSAGVDTEIGPAGVALSAGQRQRLAIARALLDDPQVLLLDEATSNLDLATEAALQRSLTEDRDGRTTIAVAHRLASVRHADRIVVLDEGAVVEQGSHAELVEADGQYARLWGALSAPNDRPTG